MKVEPQWWVQWYLLGEWCCGCGRGFWGWQGREEQEEEGGEMVVVGFWRLGCGFGSSGGGAGGVLLAPGSANSA